MFIVDQVEQWHCQLDKRDIFIHLCSAESEINSNSAKHEYVNMSIPLIEHSAGDAIDRAGVRTLTGGGIYSYIQVLPTSFFCNKIDFKRN